MGIVISGIDLDDKKHTAIALQKIYGIGSFNAKKICLECLIDPSAKLSSLNDEDLTKIRNYILNNLTVEGALKKEKQEIIENKKSIWCYKATRYVNGLPAKGQRSKTNAKTAKKKRFY